MDPDLRIGDAERDEAVRRLTAHHTAGRITIEEFDDRMERALAARTAGDLFALFRDLPDDPFDQPTPRHVGAYAAPQPAPPVPAGPPHYVEQKVATPWYAQSGFVFVAFIIAMMTGFRLWPVLVVAAIVFWVIGPMIHKAQQPQVTRYAYTPGDADGELRALIRAGRKIEAVKRYREMHDVGLVQAKQAIDRLEREERGIGY